MDELVSLEDDPDEADYGKVSEEVQEDDVSREGVSHILYAGVLLGWSGIVALFLSLYLGNMPWVFNCSLILLPAGLLLFSAGVFLTSRKVMGQYATIAYAVAAGALLWGIYSALRLIEVFLFSSLQLFL